MTSRALSCLAEERTAPWRPHCTGIGHFATLHVGDYVALGELGVVLTRHAGDREGAGAQPVVAGADAQPHHRRHFLQGEQLHAAT